jgi:uroporphyrin-III C-methyltransferase / precorrin-2 dehydrogenase / sirohydrochlorin ferrochelatase
MNQLPIFVTLRDRNVMLLGDGEAADAKRRLIQRAGGVCVGEGSPDAMLAFVAVEDSAEAAKIAARLKTSGLLVNVVDQPTLCDFTTPAIIDRDPVLVAIGTGGASAGLAKALRQRLEALLPQNLGSLANGLSAMRDSIRQKWPDNMERRKAIDDALSDAGILDPLSDIDEPALGNWLAQPDAKRADGVIEITLTSADPDNLTLRQARLLGQADHIYAGAGVPELIVNRARADATRQLGAVPENPPEGLVLSLQMDNAVARQKDIG